MTQTRSMLLNVGPSHPATHGVIRLIMELDGEKIKGVDVEIGYLHRAFEKMCETVMYTQCFPYTDRLNYVSPLINNVSFALEQFPLADRAHDSSQGARLWLHRSRGRSNRLHHNLRACRLITGELEVSKDVTSLDESNATAGDDSLFHCCLSVTHCIFDAVLALLEFNFSCCASLDDSYAASKLC